MDEKINVIFLDYDGVICTDRGNFSDKEPNLLAVNCLNKFCLEYNFKIVISSSWRQFEDYREFFYKAGIDRNINIVGATEINDKGRTYQIENYLKAHDEIENYLIVDDGFFSGELGSHAIQTAYNLGFTENKYKEAVEKYEKLKNGE